MRRFVGTAVIAVALLMLGALPAGAVSSAQLKAKALSLSNFPTGWSVDNSSSSGTSNISCLKGLQSSFKHEVKASVRSTDGNFPALQETIETGPGVSARLTKFEAALGSCTGISGTSGGQTITGSVGAMSFPTVGNRSSAYAITLQIQGITVGADVVVFQTGKVIGEVVYEDVGTPDAGQRQAFVTEAVNKVEDKPTTTPTTF
jgi:hypothetical protein